MLCDCGTLHGRAGRYNEYMRYIAARPLWDIENDCIVNTRVHSTFNIHTAAFSLGHRTTCFPSLSFISPHRAIEATRTTYVRTTLAVMLATAYT